MGQNVVIKMYNEVCNIVWYASKSSYTQDWKKVDLGWFVREFFVKIDEEFIFTREIS